MDLRGRTEKAVGPVGDIVQNIDLPDVDVPDVDPPDIDLPDVDIGDLLDEFRNLPNIGEAGPRPWARADMIAANPDYGRIVCHCERVTRGEIDDALRAAIPARGVDGLRRRTRALLGRCQGFYCAATVLRLLADARGTSIDDLLARDGTPQ